MALIKKTACFGTLHKIETGTNKKKKKKAEKKEQKKDKEKD